MKLLSGERIIKVYHHHVSFFVWRSIKIWMASLPFFMLAFIFQPILPNLVRILLFGSLLIIFMLANLYDLIMYYLDTLIISNQRIVHLDWINPFRYSETEAMLYDIQYIETEENGFLSQFSIFDFGSFMVETASTRTVISFDEAPDPEGIKFFVTNISGKHSVALEGKIMEKPPALSPKK